jgi:hypothetical protein
MDKFLKPPKKQNTAAAADLDGATSTTDSTGSAMKSKKNASSSANKQNLQYQIAVRAEAKENSRRNPRSATEHYTKDRSYACFHIAKREAGSCRCEYLNDLDCFHGFADLQSGIPEFVSGVNGGEKKDCRKKNLAMAIYMWCSIWQAGGLLG